MLIDWLTLRHPLNEQLGAALHERIMANMGHMVCSDSNGVVLWTQAKPDWDAIRSDSQGLYWSITADGDSVRYLTIGASPSSLLNAGVNVFGSLDLQHGSEVLLRAASKALETILPNWTHWQCRRIDVTANYDMGSATQVKQALRYLLGTDAPRRKGASDSKGGDSVYWNGKSALRAGKAYHKGAHLRFQQKKGNIAPQSDELLDLADRLIRLELKLGSMWFRRLERDWHDLTANDLAAQHENFFSSLLGGGDLEVTDMHHVQEALEKVTTKGRAAGALKTWAFIKSEGYTMAKETMNYQTFHNHLTLLRAAGLCSADFCAGKVLEFRKKALVLDQPVLSWSDMRRAA